MSFLCLCASRSDTVVEAQFSHMNRVDKERVVVPLLEHMDQGAKCRLITCPFHNHGRDPRALSKEDLDAAIEAAKRDAEAKAKADEEARLAAEQQALRESAAGQRLRRWLKKRGAVCVPCHACVCVWLWVVGCGCGCGCGCGR